MKGYNYDLKLLFYVCLTARNPKVFGDTAFITQALLCSSDDSLDPGGFVAQLHYHATPRLGFHIYTRSSWPLPVICAEQTSRVQRRARSMAAALSAVVDAALSIPLVMARLLGAGVLVRVGGADRLCCMCALTRCPAARALQSDSSPASTAAATMRANRLAFSPGLVG